MTMSRAAAPTETPKAGLEPVLLRSITFFSDLGPQSDAAFAHARLLAENFGARITLCHLLDRSKVHGRGQDEVLRRARERALEHLSVLAEGLTVPHAYSVYDIRDIGAGLVEHVRSTRPDLTVMATHGRGALGRVLIGSLSEEILDEGGRPVLVLREPAHGVALPYRRILLPVDLNAASRRALPWVELLVRGFGAEVVLAHVVDDATVSSLVGVPDQVEQESPAAGQLLSFVQPELQGARVTVRVGSGSVEEQFLEIASTERADLLVMASRGLHSVQDALRGTLTERLARRAPCPVLAV